LERNLTQQFKSTINCEIFQDKRGSRFSLSDSMKEVGEGTILSSTWNGIL